MPETGRRFLAPTAQGTGDGLTVGNAAAASTRLTHEAALHAAAVADGALKASGTPADVAIEMCWRADLGPYNLSAATVYSPNATHGGVSPTRKLRHISVDATGAKVAAVVSRDHATEVTTHTGEASVALFVGTRTDDPRSAGQKTTVAVNVGTVDRYCWRLDLVSATLITPGQGMNLATGAVVALGGVWTVGNLFEAASGAYGYVIWDGFKWKRWNIPFTLSGGSTAKHVTVRNCYAENIKNFCRNASAAAPEDITFDGIYTRGFAQAHFRADYGTRWTFSNFDIDGEFQVGDRITCGSQLGPVTTDPAITDVAFSDFLIANCWDAASTAAAYRQGDGLSAELGCANMTVERGRVQVVGDGGLDLKAGSTDPAAPAVAVTDVDVYDAAHYSYRLWGGDGNGLYNRKSLTDVRSFRPALAHLEVTGDTVEWVNPGGGTAMTDDVGVSTEVVSPSALTGHILVTLRDLILSRDPSSPPVGQGDNTATYPTVADAEAAGTKQVRIQEVTGAGWSGTILVDGVVYAGGTLVPDETVTNEIEVTGVSGGEVAFTLLPDDAGALTPVDSTTVQVTWADTDGLP